MQPQTQLTREKFSLEICSDSIAKIRKQIANDASKHVKIRLADSLSQNPDEFLKEIRKIAQQEPTKFKELIIDEEGNRILLFPSVSEDGSPYLNPCDLRFYSDIHATPEVFDCIEAEIKESKAKGLQLKTYINLGDYIDRGGEDPLSLQKAEKLKADSPDNIFLLRGNHDQSVLNHDFLPTAPQYGQGDLRALLSGKLTESLPLKIIFNYNDFTPLVTKSLIQLCLKSYEAEETTSNAAIPTPLRMELPLLNADSLTTGALKKVEEQTKFLFQSMPLGAIIPASNQPQARFYFTGHGFPFSSIARSSTHQLSINLLEARVSELRRGDRDYFARIDRLLGENNFLYIGGHIHDNGLYGANIAIVNSGPLGGELKVLCISESGQPEYQLLPLAEEVIVTRKKVAALQFQREMTRVHSKKEEMSHSTNFDDIISLEHPVREQFLAAFIAQIVMRSDNDFEKMVLCKTLIEYHLSHAKDKLSTHLLILQIEIQLRNDPRNFALFNEFMIEFLKDPNRYEVLTAFEPDFIIQISLSQIVANIFASRILGQIDNCSKILTNHLELLKTRKIKISTLRQTVLKAIIDSDLSCEDKRNVKIFADEKLAVYYKFSSQITTGSKGIFAETWASEQQVKDKLVDFLTSLIQFSKSVQFSNELSLLLTNYQLPAYRACYSNVGNLVDLFAKVNDCLLFREANEGLAKKKEKSNQIATEILRCSDCMILMSNAQKKLTNYRESLSKQATVSITGSPPSIAYVAANGSA